MGDERFADAGGDNGGGRISLTRDIVEGVDDTEDRSGESDERRDDGDRADDAQIALQHVEVLHQRYGERICDVRAIFRSALETELEDPGQHALLVMGDSDRSRHIVGGDFRAERLQKAFAISVLLREEHETFDHDRERQDRHQDQDDHDGPALLDEFYETAKRIHSTYGASKVSE